MTGFLYYCLAYFFGVSQELKGKKFNFLEIMTYFSTISNEDLSSRGMDSKEMKKVAKYFFKVQKFESFEKSIDAGLPVVAWYRNGSVMHFVLAIGYNKSSHEIIYLNSLTGLAERKAPSSFHSDVQIPLKKNR